MAPSPVDLLQPIFARVRQDVCWVKRPGTAPVSIKEPLTAIKLARHTNGGPYYGVCPIQPGTSVTLCAVLDLDNHDGALEWTWMADAACRLSAGLALHHLAAVPFRSTSGRGVHLYVLWDTPQDCRSVREMLRSVLAECGFRPGTKGVAAGEVEIFPKQDHVPAGGFGSMFILPLAGESVPLGPEWMDVLPKDTPFAWPSSPPVPISLPAVVAPPPTAHLTAGLEDLKALLARIPNDSEPLSYDRWRDVVFAIHSATSGSDDGLALAHAFSARSSKYDPAFLDNRVWPFIRERDGGITVATLEEMARTQPATLDEFEVLADVEDVPRAPAKGRFTPKTLTEFVAGRKARKWLIKYVLPDADLAVLYGASGSGKSFLALDMCCALAAGEPWRGRKTTKCRVVYVVAEGSQGFLDRVLAYASHNGKVLSDMDILVIDEPLNLLEKADALAFVKGLASSEVGLVVIDTLAQTTPGGNENSSEDMGRALANCRLFGRMLGCMTLLIHHSGKEGAKGARGWSGIKGALDAEIEVTRDGDARAAEITKLKDGQGEGDRYGFQLEVINLRLDEEGEWETSCVVDHEGAAPGKNRKKGFGAKEKMVLDAVCDALDPLSKDDLVAAIAIKTEGNKGIPMTARQSRNEKANTLRAIDSLIACGKLHLAENYVLLSGED